MRLIQILPAPSCERVLFQANGQRYRRRSSQRPYVWQDRPATEQIRTIATVACGRGLCSAATCEVVGRQAIHGLVGGHDVREQRHHGVEGGVVLGIVVGRVAVGDEITW